MKSEWLKRERRMRGEWLSVLSVAWSMGVLSGAAEVWRGVWRTLLVGVGCGGGLGLLPGMLDETQGRLA